jgi:hypothetical protein
LSRTGKPAKRYLGRGTLSILSAFKKPHGGIAALNGATWGSVPIVVT